MSAAEPGRVYLVGAGPGDPGLLSARALELIEQADVILHDRLVHAAALRRARTDAELVYVGKEGGGRSVPQARCQELMIAHARAGELVVRLKGGDPFVFGRGGEEALALRAAGLAYEVVPGITAGIAACAYAGIPVTHRGRASAVALITGHEDPGKDAGELDWSALARFPGTLVFYMGVRRLEQLTAALTEAGRDGSEPAAVVQSGTLPQQRSVTGTLSSIAQAAHEQGLTAPAIAVVGPVAALASQLSWFSPGPLAGRTVAVTRARVQASALAQRLEALGARVLQAPAIRVLPLPGPPVDPSPYDLVCLTSANGVELLFERLAAGGRDARALAGAHVAAIGAATAAALAAHGIVADVVADRYVAEALIETLAQVTVRRALVARAREAREALPEALRARGAHVDVLALYETIAEPLSAEVLAGAREADYITFTSSSTVGFFLDALGADGRISERTRIVSIGPVTSEALRARGLEPDVEAARHDSEGVVQALLADALAGAGRG